VHQDQTAKVLRHLGSSLNGWGLHA